MIDAGLQLASLQLLQKQMQNEGIPRNFSSPVYATSSGPFHSRANSPQTCQPYLTITAR